MELASLFGGAAIFTTIGLIWDKLKWIAGRCTNVFFESITINGNAAETFIAFIRTNPLFKRPPFQPLEYLSSHYFIKPLKRQGLVAMCDTRCTVKTIFFQKWRPLIIGNISNKDGYPTGQITISFIRKTFNFEKLLQSAVDRYNELHQNVVTGNRFTIVKHYGSGGVSQRRATSTGYDEKATPSPAKSLNGPPDDLNNLVICGTRFLRWNVTDLGEDQEGKKAYDILAFPKEVNEFVEEIERWKQSESWYREKSIPWKRGWLLYGKPGTGKSALIRAMGQYLDIPIHVFDLSTMSNAEFNREWGYALESVPCIILIEDIDATFRGRDNRLGEAGGGLSFDCVLNCISGIQKADGVFLIITTNNIEDLDEALGKPRTDKDVNGTHISTRPGRIDRALELRILDEDCRKKIACRILSDCTEFIDQAVKDGEGDTGAQFQERCAQIALKCFWNKNK